MTDDRSEATEAGGAAGNKSTYETPATVTPAPAPSGIAGWSTQKKVLVGCGVGLLLLVGLLGACGAFVYSIFQVTSPVATVGDEFMTALRDGNYQRAFDMGTPSFQREAASAEGLQRIVTNGRVQPTEWSFSSRNINNTTGRLEGTATFTGGRRGTVLITLENIGDVWKVSGFNLRES